MIPLRGRYTAALRLAAFALAVAGAISAHAGIRLAQAGGGSLDLPEPAGRIITLAPSITELLYTAGAGDLLVATVEYSDHPAEALDLPRIGDAFRFDLERTLAFEPDLVIAWQSGNPQAALAKLESLGLPLWRTEIRTPADMADLLEAMGRATGRVTTAMAAAARLRERLAGLRERFPDPSPITYFYQVAERPLYTVNGSHLISQGLAICGGVNVFADVPALAPQVAREAVLVANPDVLAAPRLPEQQDPQVAREAVLVANPDVLAAPRLPEQQDPLSAWRAWPRLEAVQAGRFLYLPADAISRATPRLLDAVELACNLLDGFRTPQEP